MVWPAPLPARRSMAAAAAAAAVLASLLPPPGAIATHFRPRPALAAFVHRRGGFSPRQRLARPPPVLGVASRPSRRGGRGGGGSLDREGGGRGYGGRGGEGRGGGGGRQGRRRQRRRGTRYDGGVGGDGGDGADRDRYGDPSRPGVRDGGGADPAIAVPLRVNAERLSSSIDCEHFGPCPGCVTDGAVGGVDAVRSARSYFSSAAVRKNLLRSPRSSRGDYGYGDGDDDGDDFFRVVIPSPLAAWRTQAKLAVAPKSGRWGRDGCVFGLYRRGTHDVLPIPRCAVHHPSINRAVDALASATAAVGTAPYDEDTGDGGLRYVQAQVERSSGRVCLTLVWNAETVKGAQPGLSRLAKELRRLEPGLWRGIWAHLNAGAGNAIFARGPGRWHRLDGPEFLREALPGTDPDLDEGTVHYTPSAFRQGNLDGFDKIALHVARAVPPGSKVCELYAGVGVLGLTALSHHAREADAYAGDVEWYGEAEARRRLGLGGGRARARAEEPRPLGWLRCSDENPANPRCFDRAVGSMPPEVTGRAARRDGRSDRRGRRGSGGGGRRRGDAGRGGDEGVTIAELMERMEREARGGGSGGGRHPGGADDGGGGVSVSYAVASAADALRSGQALGADVLIVDPPRRGLCPEVLSELCRPPNPNQPPVDDIALLPLEMQRHPPSVNWANDVTTLVYVSCGFDALARDCDRLLSAGGGGGSGGGDGGAGAGWKLESATGYVLFPGSDHVETVAVFKRRSPGRAGRGGGGWR